MTATMLMRCASHTFWPASSPGLCQENSATQFKHASSWEKQKERRLMSVSKVRSTKGKWQETHTQMQENSLHIVQEEDTGCY
eukprot:scaffold123102_cov14-Tisochrysis_lutea.AAC.1